MTNEFSELETLISANPIDPNFIESQTKSHNLLAISYYASLLNCLNPKISEFPKSSSNLSVPISTFPFQLTTNCALSKPIVHSAISQALIAKKEIDKAGISKKIVSLLDQDPNLLYGPEQEKLLILKSKFYQYNEDVDELVKLGIIFYFGSNSLGIKPDYKLALSYFKKAAKFGSKKAAAKLGKMYLKGQGVAKNVTKAIKYLKIAANKDSLEAIKTLTLLYEKGTEVEKNLTLAAEYAVKGMELGDIQSYNNLGVYYMNGMGVRQDKVEGIKYVAAAAVMGSPVAMYNMASAYYNSKIIHQDLTQSLNLSLAVIHAAQQDDFINLGFKYYKQKDYKTAYLYYLFAAGLGYEEAFKALSFFWLNGLNENKCKANEKWCLEYYLRLGISLGDQWSSVQLGKLLISSEQKEQAKEVFENCKESGEKLYFLGYIAEYGIGCTQNYTAALGYYEQMISLAGSKRIDEYSKYPGLISYYLLRFKMLCYSFRVYFSIF